MVSTSQYYGLYIVLDDEFYNKEAGGVDFDKPTFSATLKEVSANIYVGITFHFY